MKYKAISIDITKVSRSVGKGRISWPFKNMEANDAIIVEDGDFALIQRRAHSYAARANVCFVTRTTDEGLIIKRTR